MLKIKQHALGVFPQSDTSDLENKLKILKNHFGAKIT